ncbi:MAG: hypothetical protein NC310_07975 [Roseburia sp.]|nr:hypothetical protein [Anaeroplasma bactoclasticum]MCM1196985.1 hypothetical protein [Roseburia sp.]MCM1556528.1 hypothetical protein [Anaeroplasma bactoclasticum]
MEQKTKQESIWVDGVPSKIEDKDRLEPRAVLNMCVRFVLENILNRKKYDILAASDDPNLLPNIEAKLEDRNFAIAVIPCIYPYFMPKNDKLRIGFAKAAKEKGYIPVICPIPIRSIDKDRAEASIYLKGDLFQFANIGQIIATEEENQEILPQTLNFSL